MDRSSVSSAESCCFDLSKLLEFDCNICSERPINPVETACGHLFCWPCMHRHIQGGEMPCPVCGAVLSSGDNVIPIATDYGALLLYLPAAEQSDDDHEDRGSGNTLPAAEQSRDDHEDRSSGDTKMLVVLGPRATEETTNVLVLCRNKKLRKQLKRIKRLQRRVRRAKRLLRDS